MDTSDAHASETTTLPAWQRNLDEEITQPSANDYESKLPTILRHMLSTYIKDNDTALRHAAEAIDRDYWDKYLPADPLLKGQDDKGMSEFLNRLYDLIFMLARLIPYDDARQPALVGVLLELQKLPPNAFKIWGEDCQIYRRDPIFALMSEDNWNGYFVDEDTMLEDEADEAAQAIHSQECHEWTNLSTFLAQCTGLRLYDHYKDRFKYPCIDIPLGLEKEQSERTLGVCRLLVAAQWIRYAGGPIYQDILEVNRGQWTLEKWTLWTQNLGERASNARLNGTDREVIVKAFEVAQALTSTRETEAEECKKNAQSGAQVASSGAEVGSWKNMFGFWAWLRS